ncbi:MAG: myo-inosose-2 dehydratase [Treponema sp.]|nr:myo-inosose-2 dehydratase [Treponema sp.]
MLDRQKIKLAIAPIAWTNDDMPDLGKENTFEQCISEMALAGFSGSEIGNKYPKDGAVLKKALDMRGLCICNCWFSTFLISKRFEETADAFDKQTDFLKSLGADVIGVSEQSYSIQGKAQPVFEGKYVMNDKEWDLLCAGLNKLGEIAHNKGMKLTFHHHMGTVVQDENEIDRMMQNTDPDLMFLLFDSGHLSYCGIDPQKIIERYSKRIGHIHLKDIRANILAQVRPRKLSFLDAVREGVFTVPGDGSINFDPIFKCIETSGYEGWLVVEAEQDPARANPFEYAKKARAFIREKTGL